MQRDTELDVHVVCWSLLFFTTSVVMGHATSNGMTPKLCDTCSCHLHENIGPYLIHQTITLLQLLVACMGIMVVVLWILYTRAQHTQRLADDEARARRLSTRPAPAAKPPAYQSPRRRMAQKAHFMLTGVEHPERLGVVDLGLAAHTELYPPPVAVPSVPPPAYQAPPATATAPADQVAQWAREAREDEQKNYDAEALRICKVYFDLKKKSMLDKPMHYIPVHEAFASARVAKLVNVLVKPQTMYAEVAGNSVVIREGKEPLYTGTPSQGWSPYDD